VSQAVERKVVTSLFCDLAGFTAASEAADPEDVQQVLEEYFRLARAHIEGHGGVIEKFIGDAVVGVFGVPAAREDDPERAVRAGLRICEGAADLRGLRGETLELRVGINTGTALVQLGVSPASGQGFVTGDAVNTAARLQSAAPVGGVAVGLATWEATMRVFEYQELEPAVLKGKAEPVRAFRPIQPRARMGVDLTRTHDSPFVGRAAELEALTGAFDRAVANRAVEFVTVVGEPGLGKSRLVGELSEYVDRSRDLYRWRQGRCLPYGDGIAFWALGEIVKAHAGILESDTPELAREKLEQVLPEGEERPWFRERLLPLLGIEAGSSGAREESFTAWRRFLEQLAADRPTVLAFEDLHWAGAGMLAFLDHLAANLAAVPLLIVSTTRPELYDRYPAHGAGLLTVRLTPLSHAESGQLVNGLLEATMLPAELQQLIRERTAGNPLFTQEFVALLRDRGLIVRTGSGWELLAATDVPLPDSVQAVIAARLDTLGPEAKAVVGDAAVIGKVFWAGAVAEMGGRDPAAVMETLGELVFRQLVAPARRSSMIAEVEYAFGHALVRDVAYEQLPRPVRATRHLAAASWIEAKVADRVEDFADVLAYHYATALDLARAVGEPDRAGELEAPALRFSTLAGERALGLDTDAALRSFERALALTPPGHPGRPAALARYGEAASDAGRVADAVENLEQAIAGFEAAGEPRAAARAAIVLGQARDRDPRSLDVLRRALELLEPLPPGPERVDVLSELAAARWLAEERGAALDDLERAIALARRLGMPPPIRAIVIRAQIRGRGAPSREILTELREAIRIATDGGEGRQAAALMNVYAMRVAELEGAPTSIASLRAGVAFARVRGISAFDLLMTVGLGAQLSAAGELDESLEVLDAVAERAEVAGNTWLLARARALAVRVLVLRGRPADAAPSAWFETLAGEGAHTARRSLCLGAAAILHAAFGERDAAAEQLSAIAAAELPPRPLFGPMLVRASIEIGELHSADAIALKTTGLAGLAARAAVAEARSELDAALDMYLEDITQREKRGELPALALAVLGHGRTLAALGRAPEAIRALRRARELLAALGAVPALVETDALLADLKPASPPGGSPPP
jgi:class 3 adenylate cyclase/tetratricopeptide (TPR) repeat protein